MSAILSLQSDMRLRDILIGTTFILALALGAGALPVLPSNGTSNGTGISIADYHVLNARSSCTPGALVCNGLTQFGLCNHNAPIIWQPVAAGTECLDGAITWAGSSSESPAPTTTTTHTTTSTPPPKPTSSTTHTSSPPPTSTSPTAPPTTTSKPYTFLSGDGQPSKGWPTLSLWHDFSTLWTSNLATLTTSCTQYSVPNNTPQELASIKSSILTLANTTGVDERYILSIMLQESGGCVRVATTNYGVSNPGLFQSHNGKGSCNSDGVVQTPCPESEIMQMVRDGVQGTESGDGLMQLLQQADAEDVSRYYKAARMYNSGSIAQGGNLDAGIATHCYASDVANRLVGWTEGGDVCVKKLGSA